MKLIFTLFSLFFSISIYAQTGVVSGTFTDSNDLPLPGVNVMIKGTNRGTQTDFDGNYSIACNVGDTIVISYIGFNTQEIVVTSGHFKEGTSKLKRVQPVIKKEVQPIISNAFTDKVKKNRDTLVYVISMKDATTTYNKKTSKPDYRLHKIKSIKIKDSFASLKFRKESLYLSGDFISKTNISNISTSLLPVNTTSIFQETLSTRNHIGLEAYNASNNTKIGVAATFETIGNYFKQTENKNNSFKAYFKDRIQDIGVLETQYKYLNSQNNLVNINGYQSLLLLSQWKADAQNSLDTIFKNSSSTSRNVNHHAQASLAGDFDNELSYKAGATFSKIEQQQHLELQNGIFATKNPYALHKGLENTLFSSNIGFHTNDLYIYLFDDDYLATNTTISYRHQKLDYNVFENLNTVINIGEEDLNKNVLEIKNDAEYTIWQQLDLKLSLYNTSLISSTQGTDLWTPQVDLYINPARIIYSDFFNYLGVHLRYGETIQDAPLFYNNYSHNSIILNSNEAFNYRNSLDLFTDNVGLDFERSKQFEINTDMRLWGNRLFLGAHYIDQKNEGSIFPVLENNSFSLQNIANIDFHSLDVSLEYRLGNYRDTVQWYPSLSFSKSDTNVRDVFTQTNQLQIGGFKDVGNYLTEGQPAGVIIGSAYARDTNNNIILDNSGNPQIAKNPKIIGNPTPDYTLVFSNDLSFKKFNFNVSIRHQKGGDIWNGTNQYLQVGTPAIAEAAIVDGSFFNLSSLALSYDLIDKKKDHFFSTVQCKVYTNNLMTWSNANIAPSNNLLFNTKDSRGINFFNTPLARETGISIIAKI